MATLKKVLQWIGIVAAALALLAVVLYNFGGMWVRTPEMRDAYDAMVTEGTAEPVEAAFVVPIPGCVCHSDDPVQQAEHSVRRIRDCSGCH